MGPLINLSFADIFAGTNKFVVPVYQRNYVWTEINWSDLWNDLEEMYQGSHLEHFTGVAVWKTSNASDTLEIVDGQQRLITYCIVICAMLREGKNSTNHTRLEELVKGILLTVGGGALIDDCQLEPKIGEDRNQLQAIMQDAFNSLKGSIPNGILSSAYEYFRGRARNTEADLFELCDTLSTKFKLGTVSLNEEDGHSAYFFECLNNRGRHLAPFDQLRNSMFLRAGTSAQSYYNQWWAHFDSDAWWTDERQADLLKNALVVKATKLENCQTLSDYEESDNFRVYRKYFAYGSVAHEAKEFHDLSVLYKQYVGGTISPDPLAAIRFLATERSGIEWPSETWLPVILLLALMNPGKDITPTLAIVEKYVVWSGLIHGINSVIEPTFELMKILFRQGASVDICKQLVTLLKHTRKPPLPESETVKKFLERQKIGNLDPFRKRLILYVLYKTDIQSRGKVVDEPGIEVDLDQPDWIKTVERVHNEHDRLGGYIVSDKGSAISDDPGPVDGFQPQICALRQRKLDLVEAFFKLWP